MTGIIILAAGASTRLGRAKQSLLYNDKTLLKHAIDSAVNAGLGPVVVVIGANEKEILIHVENEPVQLVHNKNWKDGIASSIKAGLTTLLKHRENIENLILMVCDQPYVNESLLKNLLHAKIIGAKPIIACSYNGTMGVPALFDKAFFNELLELKGDEGGKKVLLKHEDLTGVFMFPSGATDIDTVADYETLING